MQYRHFGKLDFEPSLLGFGAMRLPVIKKGDETKIDTNEAIRMIRYAIDNGVNYVDTAWTYHNGQSEIVVGQALKDGYREKVMLATKNPTKLIMKPEDWACYLDEELGRLQTDHIDFYLQHAMNAERFEKFNKLNLWDKAMEAKKSGKIKYFGFSFHDNQETFMKIIDSYDWDFCQIQFNYLDTEYQAGLKGLHKAASKNIGVSVMEPLRGGRLATGLPKDLLDMINTYPIKRTPVEWAMRYVASQPEVSVMLSGMNTFKQVEENLKICSAADMIPNNMSSEELSFIEQLATSWKNKKIVGCTGCNYCMPCPQGVNIPGCFSIYNYSHSANAHAERKSLNDYRNLSEIKSDAANCAECGACESACPQNIPIIETLKVLHAELT